MELQVLNPNVETNQVQHKLVTWNTVTRDTLCSLNELRIQKARL